MLDGHNSAFDWDSRFMRIAIEVSTWSKDPDTKVGSVIVSEDGRKISWGYNGFPRGIADDARLNDRDLKRKLMVHAELNALSNADFPLSEAALYSTMYPCHICAGPIIQSGIALVVAPKALKHWENSQSLAALMFREAGIGVRELEMENHP